MKKGRVLSLLLVMVLLLVGGSIPSHAVDLETALQNVVLGFAEGDDAENVSQNIVLPSQIEGLPIQWTSNDAKSIRISGQTAEVKLRPGYINVTLTATISDGLNTKSRNFELKVNASEPPVAAVILMREDFEGTVADYNQGGVVVSGKKVSDSVKGKTSNWLKTNTGITEFAVTDEDASGENQVLRFSASKGQGASYLSGFFTNSSVEDKIVVKYRYKLETTETGDFLGWLLNESVPAAGTTGTILHRLAVFRDKIIPQGPAGNLPSCSIVPSAWQDVTIVFDHTTKTYDFYLNGKQVVTGYGAYANQAINKMLFGHDRSFTLSLDDMLVYLDSTKNTAERIEADLDAISVPDIVTENLKLPSAGSMGSSIVWQSSREDVITVAGNVMRPAVDTYVRLTATLTYETEQRVFKKVVLVPKKTPVYYASTDFGLASSDKETVSALSTASIPVSETDFALMQFDMQGAPNAVGGDGAKYVLKLKLTGRVAGRQLSVLGISNALTERTPGWSWTEGVTYQFVQNNGYINTAGQLICGDRIASTILTDDRAEFDISNFVKRQKNGSFGIALTLSGAGDAAVESKEGEIASAPVLEVQRQYPDAVPMRTLPSTFLNNGEIYSLPETGGTIISKSAFYNQTGLDASVMFITALYQTVGSTSVLKDVKVDKRETVAKNQVLENLENQIDIPSGGQYELKAFLWSGSEKLQPIGEGNVIRGITTIKENDISDTTSICEVKDNKKAIWTFTSDDSLIQSCEYFSDQFNRLGLRGTLAMVLKFILNSDGTPNDSIVNRFKAIFANDNFDITNHTYDHTKPLERPDDVVYWRHQIHDAQERFEEIFPGERVFTVANPWVQNTPVLDSIIKERNWAGRNGTNTTTDFAANNNSLNPSEEEWFRLKWQHGNSSCTLDRMKGWVDAALRDGTWVLELWHGVDGEGSSPVSTSIATPYFEYVASKKEDLWIATFNEAVAYLREKQRSDFTVTQITQDKYEVLLTHELPQEIFNYPLTMRTRVPQDWNNAQITQNGTVLDVAVQEIDGIRYAVYDVVPNIGAAIIEKTN